VVAFLLFGAKRLPELGKGLGEGLKGFKEGIKGVTDLHRPLPYSSRAWCLHRLRQPPELERNQAELIGPAVLGSRSESIRTACHKPFSVFDYDKIRARAIARLLCALGVAIVCNEPPCPVLFALFAKWAGNPQSRPRIGRPGFGNQLYTLSNPPPPTPARSG